MFKNTIAKLILIIGGGLLLSLSAPGFDKWFLAWFCLAPLFFVINLSKKNSSVAFYSFLFGFVYNLSYLHWVFTLHPLTWLGLNEVESLIVAAVSLIVVASYNAVFFCIFGLIYRQIINLTKRNCKDAFSTAIITFIWIILFNKCMSSKILLGFPWSLVEYSQYKNIYITQIAEYCGSLSIGFLIVFFNLALSNILTWFFNVEKIGNRYISKDPGELGTALTSFLLITTLICSTLIFGHFKIKEYKYRFTRKSKIVSIIQGNLPIKATRGKNLDLALSQKIYSNLINSTRSDYIIIPEGAIPTAINKKPLIKSWLQNISEDFGADIIAGSYCKKNHMTTNCAITYNKKNDLFSYYEKTRLVPFGEFVPLYGILPLPLQKFADLTIGRGFSAGKELTPIALSSSKIGISICFELIFPTIIREFTLKGAGLLVNLSDLSWFSSNHTKKQFLAFGVFRAIENRKPVIISTNNGISAIIEPSGRIRAQSSAKSQSVTTSWINTNEKQTFYSRFGW